MEKYDLVETDLKWFLLLLVFFRTRFNFTISSNREERFESNVTYFNLKNLLNRDITSIWCGKAQMVTKAFNMHSIERWGTLPESRAISEYFHQ